MSLLKIDLLKSFPKIKIHIKSRLNNKKNSTQIC